MGQTMKTIKQTGAMALERRLSLNAKHLMIWGMLCMVFTFVLHIRSFAQEIDASKPTNFYTQLDNSVEFAKSEGQKIYGYRGNLTYAVSAANLLLAELPVLHNDRTGKTGLGDIRARYFWLPYKDYSQFVGAFGPSVDLFAPTGSFEDGLGTSSWIISPGVMVGLMAADWIQFFPILSYQYVSKPTTDAIPDSLKKSRSGMTFQVLIPIVFSPKFFMQVTPVYAMNDFDNSDANRFAPQVNAAYVVNSQLQLSGFFNGVFKDEAYTFRLGLTVFL